MSVIVVPQAPPDRQESGSVSAIASDLERLTADLDRISRHGDEGVSVAVEDAQHALCRAVVAVREVLAAAIAAAGPFANVTLS